MSILVDDLEAVPEAGGLFLSDRRNIETIFSEVQLKSFVRRAGIKGIPKQAIQILKVNASHRHGGSGMLG